MLSAMDRFGIPDARIAFVLNDVRASGELRRIDIERTLRVTVSAELPNERDRRFAKTFAAFAGVLAASPIFQTLATCASQPKNRSATGASAGGSRDADADARCA